MDRLRLSLLSSTGIAMVMVAVCYVAQGGATPKTVPASVVTSSPTDSISGEKPQEFSQDELRRWARSGLERVGGRRERVGNVSIVGRFPDGSYAVDVMREGGTMVRGRLYKDRARYKIAFDRSSLGMLEVDVRYRNRGSRRFRDADVFVRETLRETGCGAALPDDEYGSELLNTTSEIRSWTNEEH